MLDDKYKNRNLSEVFKELEAIRNDSIAEQTKSKRSNHKVSNLGQANSGQAISWQSSNWGADINSETTIYGKSNDLKLSHIIVGCSILVVALAVFFPKSASFNASYANSDNVASMSEFELNRHRINIQNIISENSNMNRVKEQVVEERDVEFETTYNNNPTLPKSEEIVTQEGVLGKDRVEAVKTYENGEFVEEILLNRTMITEPTPKVIELGTSEFLAKHKVHLKDTMYFTKATSIRQEADASSAVVADVKQSLDVKLLELPSEEWAKVSFDSIEGYVPTANLTSATSTPNIVEKNRIQRILLKVNIDMELNKPSGLTLNDYKKIFTGLSNDTNKIFENNYQVFYNIEKKYNINGIFLASMAIHESGWGTSQIAKDKNNLFGYGSYDNTPYESSFEFADYSEGIETVAKSLVKYYLNPAGTKIYDGETASAWYFNGPTLSGVNERYASDKEWHKKVYSYMETLYNRL